MANFIRSATAQTTTYEQLPEFILNLANLVFLMNDRKGISSTTKKHLYCI